jgi:hypothetical protein
MAILSINSVSTARDKAAKFFDGVSPWIIVGGGLVLVVVGSKLVSIAGGAAIFYGIYLWISHNA